MDLGPQAAGPGAGGDGAGAAGAAGLRVRRRLRGAGGPRPRRSGGDRARGGPGAGDGTVRGHGAGGGARAAHRAGGNVALDQSAARSAAEKYLEGAGEVTYRVSVQATGIEVQVSRRAATGFLRVVGIDGVTIGASARAEPRHGVAEPGP